ncbi:MAG: hypothetical protein WB999_13585 [Candidatus Binataceae bacterium]
MDNVTKLLDAGRVDAKIIALRIINKARCNGANMLEKNGPMLRLFYTVADAEALKESLADCICSLCKRKYRNHRDADHLFFDLHRRSDPEDAN